MNHCFDLIMNYINILTSEINHDTDKNNKRISHNFFPLLKIEFRISILHKAISVFHHAGFKDFRRHNGHNVLIGFNWKNDAEKLRKYFFLSRIAIEIKDTA